MKFELEPYHRFKKNRFFHRNTPDEKLLEDLQKAGKKLGKASFTKKEYDETGEFGSTTIQKRFNGWNNALLKAGLQNSRRQDITDEELFENLEEVWIKLGRQPKNRDIHKPLSKFSTRPYARRFGGFRNALEQFIAYINNGEKNESTKTVENLPTGTFSKHRTPRQANHRLRYLMKFELEPYHRFKKNRFFHRNTPDEKLLEDLQKAGKKLGKASFTKKEYDETGEFGSTTIQRRFNGWNNALLKAGLQNSRRQDITDEELFENLEEVWIKLGRHDLPPGFWSNPMLVSRTI